MKLLRLVVSSVLFAGALAACSQPDDVPALQDEALQTAKSYRARFDELEARLKELRPDGLNGAAIHAGQRGGSIIQEYKNLVAQIPVLVQTSVKNHSADDLHKLIDEMHGRYEEAYVEAATAITAVEDQSALVHRGIAPSNAPAAPRAESATGGTAPSDTPAQ